MNESNHSNTGVSGDHAHIEGGIHFHRTPPATDPPLQLPPRPDHFTGRGPELADLMAAIRPGHTVTLWGPGGMGKSALAAEALWRLTNDGAAPPPEYPDGLIWHDFYREPQAAQALEYIARTLGQDPNPNPRQAALQALAGRRAIVLLDGAEDADDLPAVRSVTGTCAVIITTRNRHDAPADPRPLDTLIPDQSADLLRAWAGDGAENEPDDPAAVARICDLLGGLPLAICLAGGFLAESGDTAAEYLDWLRSNPLDGLDQGDRKRDSVPLLLSRSLDQVGQTARDILSILGTLAFAPVAPEPLAAALQTPAQNLKRPLTELTRYALLTRTGPRYRLKHALIHTHARQTHPPPDPIIKHLAAFFTAFAKQHAAAGLEGYARLDTDRPHILLTLTNCHARGLWEPVGKLVWAIEDYLDIRGHWTDRQAVLHSGVDAARALKDRRNEGSHLGNLGIAYRDLGQVEKAIDHFQQALAISREIGDQRDEGAHLGNLGVAYRDLGQVEKSVDYYHQALAIFRELGDRSHEGVQLGNLGIAYSELVQEESAIRHYQQALAICREIRDRRAEGNHLGNLGIAYRNLGQVRKAIDYYQQALAISREIGDRRGEGNRLGNLGIAYSDLDQLEKAIKYYQQALAISREIGDRRGEGKRLGDLGNAFKNLDQLEKAIEYHQQGMAISREIGDRRGEGNHLANLGVAYENVGQLEKAIELWEQSLAIFEEIKSPTADQVRKWLAGLKANFAP